MKQIFLPQQEIQQGLLPELAGEAFVLDFPKPVGEYPYLGQNFLLSGLALTLTHRILLKIGQSEAFPSMLDRSLRLSKNGELIGVWPVSFQMRLIPGTEGKEWIGEASVFADLNNPLDYRNGDTLRFSISGIIPGVIAGPSPTKPLLVENVHEEDIQTILEETRTALENLGVTAEEIRDNDGQLLIEVIERLNELSLESTQENVLTVLEEIREGL